MSINTPAAGQSVPVANPEAVSYGNDDQLYNHSTGTVDLPRGWKYRQYRIFGYTLPWYASPKIQLGMVAFVCFLCPGMFNALGGMGGGGKTDATLADNMVSTALIWRAWDGLLTSACNRTQPCTAPLLSSASLVAPL